MTSCQIKYQVLQRLPRRTCPVRSSISFTNNISCLQGWEGAQYLHRIKGQRGKTLSGNCMPISLQEQTTERMLGECCLAFACHDNLIQAASLPVG